MYGESTLLDFSGIYSEGQNNQNFTYIDCRDIEKADKSCSPEAGLEIRKRIQGHGPQGIHFLDTKIHHHITKFFADMIEGSFSLVLFEHHADLGQSLLQELLDGGSWVGEMLRENPYLKQIIFVGADDNKLPTVSSELKQKLVCISLREIKEAKTESEINKIRTELPVYISIDKGVLDYHAAKSDWKQDCMPIDILKKLLLEVFAHQRVIGIDICGECNVSTSVEQMLEERERGRTINEELISFLTCYYPYRKDHEKLIMEEYKQGTKLWDDVYAENPSVDISSIELSVEGMFDACLHYFAEHTKRVLDFSCGSGDVLFQYHQYAPQNRGVGIDLSKEGIKFAKETEVKSGYKKLNFFEGGSDFLENFEEGEFDGIILSNVLDVMPEETAKELLEKCNRILKQNGYWFIKINPYYSSEELQSLGYRQIEPHLYDENGVLRLHQEMSEYWKSFLSPYGTMIRYLEFPYPWQEGMNRLFLMIKN